MSSIWEEKRKFELVLAVEIAVCEAQCKVGNIPKEAMEQIRANAGFDLAELKKVEDVVKHDLIAFLTELARNVGPEVSRYIHKGLTSSDVLDTCLSLQLQEALNLILEDLQRVLEALREKAHLHQYTLCMGRSHGVHAEPTSLGLKFARFYAEFKRQYDRLQRVKKEVAVCAISGAVGTYSSLDPSIEEEVARQLGLQPEMISSQVIPRDRHAMFFAVIAVMAGSIENFAIEIRSLQRTELAEVMEDFAEGQKGSSAMPHKRNPILTENLTGLARMIRMYVNPALENIALWHERDISHSSVERVSFPDVCTLADFALHRLHGVIKGLIVNEDKIAANIAISKGLYLSQTVLLRLVDAGMSRDEAYVLVQSAAAKVWRGESEDFTQALQQEVLDRPDLKKVVEGLPNGGDYWLRNVPIIFERVFANC